MCQLQPPAQLSDATLPGLPSHPATNSWQIPHPIGPLEVSSSSSWWSALAAFQTFLAIACHPWPWELQTFALAPPTHFAGLGQPRLLRRAPGAQLGYKSTCDVHNLVRSELRFWFILCPKNADSQMLVSQIRRPLEAVAKDAWQRPRSESGQLPTSAHGLPRQPAACGACNALNGAAAVFHKRSKLCTWSSFFASSTSCSSAKATSGRAGEWWEWQYMTQDTKHMSHMTYLDISWGFWGWFWDRQIDRQELDCCKAIRPCTRDLAYSLYQFVKSFPLWSKLLPVLAGNTSISFQLSRSHVMRRGQASQVIGAQKLPTPLQGCTQRDQGLLLAELWAWGPWRERGSPAIELEDVGRFPQLKRTKSGVAADWVIVCLHKNQMVGQMEDPSCI